MPGRRALETLSGSFLTLPGLHARNALETPVSGGADRNSLHDRYCKDSLSACSLNLCREGRFLTSLHKRWLRQLHSGWHAPELRGATCRLTNSELEGRLHQNEKLGFRKREREDTKDRKRDRSVQCFGLEWQRCAFEPETS